MNVPLPPSSVYYSALKQDGVLVITVSGELDVLTFAGFRDFAAEELVERPRGLSVVLDVSGLEFLDSTGLGALVRLFKKVRGRGGAMMLAGPGSQLNDLLRVTGLRTIFPAAGTVSEAVAAVIRAQA